METKLMYKCRHCGRIYYSGVAFGQHVEDLDSQLNGVMRGTDEHGDFNQVDLHECSPNLRGVADLVGFTSKPTNND